ncbi:hypothetical protein ACOSHH_001887 [Klebsiella aerogenes]
MKAFLKVLAVLFAAAVAAIACVLITPYDSQTPIADLLMGLSAVWCVGGSMYQLTKKVKDFDEFPYAAVDSFKAKLKVLSFIGLFTPVIGYSIYCTFGFWVSLVLALVVYCVSTMVVQKSWIKGMAAAIEKEEEEYKLKNFPETVFFEGVDRIEFTIVEGESLYSGVINTGEYTDKFSKYNERLSFEVDYSNNHLTLKPSSVYYTPSSEFKAASLTANFEDAKGKLFRFVFENGRFSLSHAGVSCIVNEVEAY